VALPALGGTRWTSSGLALPEHYELLYSDLVVRGTVNAVHEELRPAGEFLLDYNQPDAFVLVTFVSVDIAKVMKGYWPNMSITFTVAEYVAPRSRFSVGTEIVAGLTFRPEVRKGTYVLRSTPAYYERVGNDWVADSGVHYSPAEIAEVVDRVTLENLAVESDAIVLASIDSISETDSLVDGRFALTLREIRFRVGQVIAGEEVPTTITVSSIAGGVWWPAWREPLPNRMRIDDEFIVFLVRAGGEFRVNGGVNGMLRRDGEKLIYNDNVVMHDDLTTIAKKIRAIHTQD
jgi:hypothetical protein